jgi:hypothetical protein
MAISNVLKLNTTGKPVAKKAAARAPRSRTLRENLAVVSGGAIGTIAVGATALSLSDLAESVQAVAHCASWKAYALAVALDANFIATEAFSLFATAAVARATARATLTTKVITLFMSAVANSYAMAHDAAGLVMQVACVIAGCSVPALIALATYTLGKAARA